MVGEGAVAAEVDGVLAAVLAPGEAVVGTEAATLVGAPGGDDGALTGEAVGVVFEVGEGFVALLSSGHAYGLLIERGFSIGELATWGGFWWGSRPVYSEARRGLKR